MKVQRTDIAVLVASLVWGINFSSVKIALLYVSPIVMGMMRFAIAGIAMLIVLKILEGDVRISWSLLRRMIIVGVIGFGVQQLFFLFGARYIDASLSALLTTFTTAVMTVVYSFVTRERLTRMVMLGVATACIGMLLVILGKDTGILFNSQSWLGLVMVLIAGIIGGFMPLINKEALAQYSASRVTAWSIVIGSLFFLPLGAVDPAVTTLPTLPPLAWAAICFTALAATAFSNILWNYGIAHIGVVRMAIYGYLPPIMGVLFSSLLLRETMTLAQWGGALLTLLGVAVSQYDKIMHPASRVQTVAPTISPKVEPRRETPTQPMRSLALKDLAHR